MHHPMTTLPAAAVGIGWRQPHYAAVMQERPPLGFLEVHAENFFAPGGAARAALRQAREHYPLSLHGVGLSLGSGCGLDPLHLDKLSALVDDMEPACVSEHASFARVQSHSGTAPLWVHANDLLPVAFTQASLRTMLSNIAQVQDRLRRPILIENLSAYLHWREQDRSEPQFLSELVRCGGCGLLLDINNLMVNACNAQADDPLREVMAWLDALSLDAQHIGEIHLAGCTVPASGDLMIDDHARPVSSEVWQAYRYALKRWGVRPTLIEWDSDIPSLDVLLAQSQQAIEWMREAQGALEQGGNTAVTSMAISRSGRAICHP